MPRNRASNWLSKLLACYKRLPVSRTKNNSYNFTTTLFHYFIFFFFLHCIFTQAKLSLRLEYIPPKPGKGVEGDITATDETDLGAELDDEFGLEDEEGVDELEGGGAEGVSEAVR